jgi:hypothetical protein
MEPALQGDIGLHDHKFSLQRDHPSQVKKKAFPGSVTPDDEAEARPTLLDSLEILQNGRHLVTTSDLQMAQSDTGNDPGAQRLKNRIPFSWPNGVTHF